jgi:hypothetical protein
MHKHKSLPLAATELRQRVGDAPPEQWIPKFLHRGIPLSLIPERTPGLSHHTPAAIVVRLTHHDAIEPRGQTGLLSEPVKGSIRLDKSLLGHIIRGRVVTPNKSPGQAPSTLAMRFNEQVETLFTLQLRHRRFPYHSFCHSTFQLW